MQKIKKLYRGTYTGEDVIREMHYKDGAWQKTSEHVPNVIDNSQTSGKAVVIGNGPSRQELYYGDTVLNLLKRHKGGSGSFGAVQTYGCNALLRDFSPDFAVANDEMAAELVNTGKCDTNIIYGTNQMVLNYPGKFYMIPQSPGWNSGAVAAYLACFDGHKKVYLMGFDLYSGELNTQYNVYTGTYGYPAANTPTTEDYFVKSLKMVMDTYNDVEFIRVMPTPNYYMPEAWKYQLNLRQIVFQDFRTEIDL